MKIQDLEKTFQKTLRPQKKFVNPKDTLKQTSLKQNMKVADFGCGTGYLSFAAAKIINPDGTVRTPIWKRGERITPDQYEVVKDVSMRMRYGTRTVARAKPGTTFYFRMAAWPVAFEEALKDANRRHLALKRYALYQAHCNHVIHRLVQGDISTGNSRRPSAGICL